MSDQSVRVTNFPSSGSPEAVAFELWKYLCATKNNPDEGLKMYVRCLNATRGAQTP